MDLINPQSNEGFVNHLATYICQILSKESTDVSIKVTLHFPNVFIISGSYIGKQQIINFNQVLQNFIDEFPEYSTLEFLPKKVQFINLLILKTYQIFDSWNIFYNTPRPLYNNAQIINYVSLSESDTYKVNSISTDHLNTEYNFRIHPHEFSEYYRLNEISSQFPHGFSSLSRMGMYTREFFAYNLFKFTKSSNIKICTPGFTPEDTLNNENQFRIITTGRWSEKKLKSLIMDVYSDYDIMSAIEDYDINLDLSHPIADKPWLEMYKPDEIKLF